MSSVAYAHTSAVWYNRDQLKALPHVILCDGETSRLCPVTMIVRDGNGFDVCFTAPDGSARNRFLSATGYLYFHVDESPECHTAECIIDVRANKESHP